MHADPASHLPLPAAVQAFDAVALTFDEQFGGWLSVAAQRRAVRRELLRTFPPGSRLLELGGGTGSDAAFLAQRRREVVLTDGAPRMLAAAAETLRRHALENRVALRQATLEALEDVAGNLTSEHGIFDGSYSNFAALNCVSDVASVGRALARLLRPGGRAVFVVFGPCAPGDMLVQLIRGNRRAAFRRFARGDVPAQLGGRRFTVRYPAPSTIARALAPYFGLVRTRGIGIMVPPSAAEPAISRFPRLLRALERADQLLARPLAWLGDHVLLVFERTASPAPATATEP
jgi:ubiquinone/menaquinone biosynthesis C-methylase UbiE